MKKLTNHATATNLYMQRIGELEVLTPQQEQELFVKIKQGDAQARQEIIERNLKLVVYIAKQYKPNSTLSFMDYVQEGNIGLMKAVDKYDLSLGCRFSTMAGWWIRQSIGKSIVNNSSTIRLPASTQIDLKNLNKITNQLWEELGRSPTEEELAQETGLSLERISILQNCQQIVSLDDERSNEDNRSILDSIAEETPQEAVDKDMLNAVLDTLTLKEKEVIVLRYGLNDGKQRTLAEVGRVIGITRERARQLERTAMRKLRCPEREEYLRNAYYE